ncbi:uncharacterized protein LOC127864763 isoform X2 [Dreissena polymorpha]|uniref:uncharacterized protein LOC127864763 isoform X2 n=1 Tax=Dreissena polymorpha TaxID=45954 RepID=UPI0022650866|nr:uncharacterized protein LOC127864763 isoform X2 [Dreissena polymorpha]
MELEDDNSNFLGSHDSSTQLDTDIAQHTVYQLQGEEGEMSVTYQIIDQQVTEEGLMQLTLSDGVNIIQTTMATDQLQYLNNSESIMLQTSNGNQAISEAASNEDYADQDTSHDTKCSQSDESLQTSVIDGPDQSETVNMLDVLNKPMKLQFQEAAEEDSGDIVYENQNNEAKECESENTHEINGSLDASTDLQDKDNSINQPIEDQDLSSRFEKAAADGVMSTSNSSATKVKVKEKHPDLSRPIEVTDHMEVMVKGKKCLLKVNPDTGQLCAYPLITTGRRRGRPRKSSVEPADDTSNDAEPSPTPETSSAAEGLLELSCGPDGVRRSSRRNKGKPKTLEDYEVFEVSSDDEAAVDSGDDEVLPSGAIRKRKSQSNKEYLPPAHIAVPGGQKRGRGRPRRYPALSEPIPPITQIPAMLIPSSDGHTIMMTPLRGYSNLDSFHEQFKGITLIHGGEGGLVTDDGTQYLNITSADGTMITLQLRNTSDSLDPAEIQPGSESNTMTDSTLSIEVTQPPDIDTSVDSCGIVKSALVTSGMTTPDLAKLGISVMENELSDVNDDINENIDNSADSSAASALTTSGMVSSIMTSCQLVSAEIGDTDIENSQISTTVTSSVSSGDSDLLTPGMSTIEIGKLDEGTMESGNLQLNSTDFDKMLGVSSNMSGLEMAGPGMVSSEIAASAMATSDMGVSMLGNGDDDDDIDPENCSDMKDLPDARSALISDEMLHGLKSEVVNHTFSTDTIVSGPSSFTVTAKSRGDGTTIIQIPEKLLPMFTQRKEPITIGLKASEVFLEKLKCRKCGYQGYYEQQYQDHIATHTEDILKCKCCKFVTFEKDDLIVHFKKNHPRCICSYCNYMSDQAYIIKRHTMRHTQEGCKCDICGKVYKDQYVMKMHVKMVHMPADVLYECNTCAKKFSRKAHLKRHLRIHEPEKPFKCHLCNYRGCEKSDITKHMLIHEEPKHVCEVCSKSFRHLKNKELHMKRHSGQRDYKCGVCDFYGYTFTDIRKHIERKHTNTRAQVCDKCGGMFQTEEQYREHKAQQCEVMMIEQALAIATTNGGTTQATIQIPCNLTLDSVIHIDGQNNVEMGQDGVLNDCSANMSGEGQFNLTEDQIRALATGQLTEADLQALVAQSQLSSNELQEQVTNGDHGDMAIHMTEEHKQMQDSYSTNLEERSTSRSLLFKHAADSLTEEDEEEEEEMEENMEVQGDVEEVLDNGMEGMESDTDDKTNVMDMVNIIR